MVKKVHKLRVQGWKKYLKFQGWLKVPKDPRLPKGT